MATVNVSPTYFMAIEKNSPTTNYNTGLDYTRAQRYSDGNFIRTLSRVTFPSLSGTITGVKFYVYAFDRQSTTYDVFVYNVLRTDWVNTEVTWNIYKTSNNWTTAGCSGAGTDYDSSEIDSIPAVNNTMTSFDLYGAGATNPITPTWGATYDFLFRVSEVATGGFAMYRMSRADVNQRPYVEITYTEDSNTTNFFYMT